MKRAISLNPGDEVQIVKKGFAWKSQDGSGRGLSTGDIGRVQKTHGPTDRADGRAVVYFPTWEGVVNIYAKDENDVWKKV